MIRVTESIWLLFLLWFSLSICFYAYRQKKLVRLLGTIPVTAISYYLLQISFIEEGIALPEKWTFIFCLISTIIIGFFTWETMHWRKMHLSDMSVKYAVDALPTGICCYNQQGRVLLKNKVMESLCRKLFSKPLLNGITFERLLFSAEIQNYKEIQFLKAGETIVVILPDQKVYEFYREELTEHRKEQEYVLIASDITEEYQKTHILLEKQKTVTELNRKLRDYNKEILSVISGQEVLNAKVKIHDELGTGLLRVKKYLEHARTSIVSEEDKEQERKEILDFLKKNVTFLKRELSTPDLDEYTLLLRTAQQLNVSIEIIGKLPEEEWIRNICVTALHECLTNTLRHAKGTILTAKFQEDNDLVRAVYTNNGIVPQGEIVEKGGLKMLRNLVEQKDGHMEIQVKEVFSLSIILKKRGAGYGI